MKRGKLEIIRDILTIIKSSKSIKITPLMRKTNLSSKRFYEYINELREKGFVKESSKEVVLTEKGFDYLTKYRNIVGFIEEFDL